MKLYEMMSLSVDFINVSCITSDEMVGCEILDGEIIDPLLDINNKMPAKYYRIDSEVFAEPLKKVLFEKKLSPNDSIEPEQDEIVTIDNVLIQNRRDKKYKKYHIHIEDATNLICPQPNCNRKFSKIKLLKAHIRKVHCADKQKYICDTCGHTFMAQYLLQRHVKTHRETKVECSVCHVVLKETSSLASHMKTHSGIKPHHCTVCNKSFVRKSTLDTHVKFVHREEKLACGKCKERFDTRSQWTRHTTTHRRSKQDGAPH